MFIFHLKFSLLDFFNYIFSKVSFAVRVDNSGDPVTVKQVKVSIIWKILGKALCSFHDSLKVFKPEPIVYNMKISLIELLTVWNSDRVALCILSNRLLAIHEVSQKECSNMFSSRPNTIINWRFYLQTCINFKCEE